MPRMRVLNALVGALQERRISNNRVRFLQWSAAAGVALTGMSAQAIVVTQATLGWGNSVQGADLVTPQYPTREAAAVGGVTYYCGLPGNVGYLSSCGFGGLSDDNRVTVATNKGNFELITVFETAWCPVNTQFFPTWNDNGTVYTPACVNWSASPPPPPPPPPPPKPVAIDPGHGFECPSKGMPVGAVGVTDFTTPPTGRLREDDLNMSIALEVKRQMPSTKYRVVLTKQSTNACPTYLDRGRIANNANAKAFVSIHINAPNVVVGIDNPFANGTSVLYNVNKSGSFNLADEMARAVSANLGLNNRGAKVDEEIAVLKPTVTRMNAVLLEAGRLSGRDEQILHSAGAASRIAAGVKSALEWFLPN